MRLRAGLILALGLSACAPRRESPAAGAVPRRAPSPTPSGMALAAGAAPPPGGAATVWNFDNPADPLAASSGPGILSYRDPGRTGWGPAKTKFGKASAFGLPPLPGGDASVMRFPATGPDEGYAVAHHAPPNGVFARAGFVSNYTLVMDLLWSPAATHFLTPPGTASSRSLPPESYGVFRSLYQTDPKNANDGDFFAKIGLGGGIGVSGLYHGSLKPGAWHRAAFVVQAAHGIGGTGQIQKFIDGRFVGGQRTPGEGRICRWALGPVFHIFADEDRETAEGYAASVFFTDRLMTMEEIAALGGPGAAGANAPGPPPPILLPASPRRVGIIAHRGNSCCAPENTLSAIDQAFRIGADGAEVDIQESADGVAFLMHDNEVDRTTDGSGPASGMTIARLKKLDAGSWFDPRYAGERVPTLVEALKLSRGRGRLLLDVKDPGMGPAIRRALRKAGVSAEAVRIFQNTDDAAAREFRTNVPDAGILWGDPPASWDRESFEALKRLGVVGFDLDISSVTRKFVEAAHENGLSVSAFTLLDPPAMLEAIGLGLDAMETDYPAVLRGLMPEGPGAKTR